MAELEVDIAALRDMAGRLKGLKEEFEDQDALITGNEDAVGSPEVAGVLNDFVDNWSDKREELGEMLEEVAGYAVMAADAYAETEQTLAANIDESAAASGSHASSGDA